MISNMQNVYNRIQIKLPKHSHPQEKCHILIWFSTISKTHNLISYTNWIELRWNYTLRMFNWIMVCVFDINFPSFYTQDYICRKGKSLYFRFTLQRWRCAWVLQRKSLAKVISRASKMEVKEWMLFLAAIAQNKSWRKFVDTIRSDELISCF